ncbi:hypothetical protein AVEN_112413-1 [Araneus ventricosus]|uniref:Uncharacterized protein n=1 Tax=Araneus ventricosus TaxID=182803 RepID=A0A4Y2HEN5_ARAVE|nr:hypothetical protein AVEN_224519-1 [Araneus ventricosus]GBM63711.1 hypothetical protein AVEN_20764-1 [Araneus ventricosus]GBM63729.1 hypothetical protein AVEN_76119-1 [Araneus ventricosus]GBM63741.1 hypothetical protein AVEN_112413-1 [Araneus ventricosus]
MEVHHPALKSCPGRCDSSEITNSPIRPNNKGFTETSPCSNFWSTLCIAQCFSVVQCVRIDLTIQVKVGLTHPQNTPWPCSSIMK